MNDMDDLFGWICALISAIGAILVNFKKSQGMYFWIVSNIMWIFYSIFIKPNNPQLFMYLIFTIINLHGIIKWRNT